jgi:hypothetical protein
VNVLALDLARVIGWAWGPPGTAPRFGSYRLTKASSSRAAAYRELRLWLDLKLSVLNSTDLIVYESPALPMHMHGHTNINAIRLLIGLCETLEEWAYDKFELSEAPVAQVRSHFIGRNMKAKLAKPHTLARCRQLGWDVQTFDEADACALWDYQCGFLRPDLAAHTTPLFAGGNE